MCIPKVLALITSSKQVAFLYNIMSQKVKCYPCNAVRAGQLLNT